MPRLLLTIALSIGIFIAGALVTERGVHGGAKPFGQPARASSNFV
jgi:hypothetical protein